MATDLLREQIFLIFLWSSCRALCLEFGARGSLVNIDIEVIDEVFGFIVAIEESREVPLQTLLLIFDILGHFYFFKFLQRIF